MSDDVCQCKDCGKKFKKGEEGDNEEYCLRCCHISLITGEDFDFDEYSERNNRED